MTKLTGLAVNYLIELADKIEQNFTAEAALTCTLTKDDQEAVVWAVRQIARELLK